MTVTGCLAFAVAGPSGAATIFTDGLLGTQNTGIDNSNSFDITEDGTTLTLATTVAGDIFNITTTGTGIEGGVGNLGDSDFNLEKGEDFTLSFSSAGTLDSITIQTLALQPTPDTLQITFTNTDSGAAAVVQDLAISGGAEAGVVVSVGLSFDIGESITVAITNPVSVDSDLRLQAVTATIPEPGSMVLSLSGAALMLFRRRK
ncbi:MAG: PEP-CTERM sorting domain-containing protein [Planctomycetota bacterium]